MEMIVVHKDNYKKHIERLEVNRYIVLSIIDEVVDALNRGIEILVCKNEIRTNPFTSEEHWGESTLPYEQRTEPNPIYPRDMLIEIFEAIED